MESKDIEVDELIERKLQRSAKLHDAMARTMGLGVDGLVVIDLHGTDIAMAANRAIGFSDHDRRGAGVLPSPS